VNKRKEEERDLGKLNQMSIKNSIYDLIFNMMFKASLCYFE
jgi:hypothetical protein